MSTTLDRTWYNALIDDDGSGNTGSVWDKADVDSLMDLIDSLIANDIQFGGSIKERGRTVAMGEWTTETFNAANFVGNGAMTWTVGSGDVVQNRYTVEGKKLTWLLQLDTTSVGGTPDSQLRVRIPGGFNLIANGQGVSPVRCSILLDNGAEVAAEVRGIPGNNTHVAIQKVTGANFTASANLTYVYVTIVLALA